MKAAVGMLLVVLFCGVIAGGCATSAMKGTPFYTGEYKTRVGTPEDRVNIWPLVYYRNPALSVLWPFIEKTDDHFAIRPLMSVYGLDEGERIYNLLWPLGRIDQRTGRHRFFPVFWSKDDLVVFPLYWQTTGYSGETLNSLFPAWIISRNGDRKDLHILWPVVNYKNFGEEDRGWRVWPVAGKYKRYGRVDTFYAWPLGYAWDNEKTRNSGSALFPVYFYDRDERSRTFISLPYSFGRGVSGRWDLGLPLFFSSRTESGSRFISPLYFAGSDKAGDRHWQCLLPFYYKGSRGKDKVLATLAGGWKSSSGGSGWAVVPALSWGSVSPDGGSFYAGAILGHRKWSNKENSSHIMPFYYSRRTEGKKLFVSLPYSHGETTQSDWKLVPPFYYGSSNRNIKTLITPLYARGRALKDEAYWSALMPFYYRDGAEGFSRLITPVGAWSRNGDERTWMVFPLLSGGKEGADSGELWLAGPLFHQRREGDMVSHHLFPLYYRNSKRGEFLSIPYCSWSKGNQVRRVVPPLLSGYTRDGERKRLSLLLGLSMHEWGGGRRSGYTLPLYLYGRDSFFTPLVGWDKSNDGFVYPLTPLLGIRTGRDSGGWLFPVFSYRKSQNQGINGTYLWGSFSSKNDDFKTGLFPLFSYRNFGPMEKDRNPAETRGYAGRKLWVLPWFWYRNLLQTAPEYEKGVKTERYLQRRERGSGFFPLWNYSSVEQIHTGQVDSGGSLLLWLFDSKYEKHPGKGQEYTRRRVLWRIYHYEKLDDDVSVDAFPFITYDRNKDGYSKFSFLWRFLSIEKHKDGRRVHVLFVPFGKEREKTDGR